MKAKHWTENPVFGNNIASVGDLRSILAEFDDNDAVVIETVDMETGDSIDLFPFYIDVIPDIKLENGYTIREIRLVQASNDPI